MSEGEEKVEGWRVFLPSWMRRWRKADITNIPVHKLYKAAKERGIRVEITDKTPGKIIAQVDKVVIKGDDSRTSQS